MAGTMVAKAKAKKPYSPKNPRGHKHIKVPKTGKGPKHNPWLDQYKWKPGESGNPKGKAVGTKNSPRVALRNALGQGGYPLAIATMKKRGINIADGSHSDLLAAVLLYKATVHEDLPTAQEIFKQIEKPLHRETDPDDPDLPSNINLTLTLVSTKEK